MAEVLRGAGRSVRALHRSTSRLDHLRALGCELIETPLPGGGRALGEAAEGCSALVHCAAVIYGDLPWPRVRELNVEATASLFRAAADAGIGRAVFLSSVAVYGGAPGPVTEETPLDGHLRPWEKYARSKREGERVVEEVANRAGMTVAVVRPCAIYGERDRLFTPKIAAALRLPLQPMLGGGRVPMAAVYAGNVATAVHSALRGPTRPGLRAYNVAHDYGLTQRDLYAGLAAALGVPFRPLSIPRSLVLAGAGLGASLGVRIPGAEDLPLRRAAALAVRPNPFVSRRIRDELGWTPSVPVDDAIGRTARWIAELWAEDGGSRRAGARASP